MCLCARLVLSLFYVVHPYASHRDLAKPSYNMDPFYIYAPKNHLPYLPIRFTFSCIPDTKLKCMIYGCGGFFS